jgi:hypothetical protein
MRRRARIAEELARLGVVFDPAANAAGESLILGRKAGLPSLWSQRTKS